MSADINKKDLKTEIEKSAKLFDVAKPGKTPAPATSRPVIVGHSSILKTDPMVRSAAGETVEDKEKEEPKETINVHKAPVIKPLSEQETSKEEASEPVEAEPEADKSAEVHKEDTEEPKEEKSEDTAKQAAVDSLVNEVSAKRDAQKKKEELDAKVQEAEDSIAKREFFVPIGQESRRRSNNLIILTVVLLAIIAVVATNFAVDAGMLDLGIQPLTDLL